MVNKSDDVLSCISNERLSCYFGLLPSFTFEQHRKSELLRKIYFSLQTISSTLFVPLHFLEISLRNRVNESLVNLYRSKNLGAPEEWYRWMPNGKTTRNSIASAIHKTVTEIGNKRPIIHGDIISRLSFGTWVSLIEEYPQNSHQYYFWSSVKKDVFPNTPNSRGVIISKLRDLNKIRNRLFHYEPIWRGNNLQDVKFNLDRTHSDIVEVVGWMSSECAKMLNNSHHRSERDWEEIRDSISSLAVPK